MVTIVKAPADEPADKGATGAGPGSEDLDAIAGEAARVDGAPAAAAATEQRQVQEQTIDANQVQLRSLLAMVKKAVVPLIGMASPRKAAALDVIWSDQVLANIAESGAEVLTLHGVQLGDLTGNFGPYLGLALALGPAAYGTKLVLEAKEPPPADEVRPDAT